MNAYEKFERWLDGLLETTPFPKNTAAINFNLYMREDENGYEIELIASDQFDAHDDDWACSEVFAARDALFVVKSSQTWDAFLDDVRAWISRYLESGTFRAFLRRYQAVAVGFTDGDLSILYQRRKQRGRAQTWFYWGVTIMTVAVIAFVCYLLFEL